MAYQSKKSSSSNRKPASNKSKTSGSRSSQKKDANDMDFILSEILYIVLVLFFVILFVGNFVPTMVVFGPFASFLRRMFGIGSYFLPILAVWYLLWEIRHKDKKYRGIKLAGIVILFFGIIIFAHLLGGKGSEDFPRGFGLFEGLYKAGSASNGGGLGGIMACAMRDGLTKAVAVLISLIIIVISLILFTGRSFFAAVGGFFKFMFGPDEYLEEEKPKKRTKKETDERQMRLEEAERYEESHYPPKKEYPGEEYYEEPPKKKKPKMFNFIIGKSTPDSREEAQKAAEYFQEKEKHMTDEEKNSVAEELRRQRMPFAFDMNKSAVVDDEGEIISDKEPVIKEVFPETEGYRKEFHEFMDKAREENPPDEAYDGDEPLIDAPLESSEEAKSAGVIASGEAAAEVKKHETTYIFPPISLLSENKETKDSVSKEEMLQTSKKLEETLASFGVTAKVVQINRGPTVTRYEVSPGTGVKVSKIANLADDIALNLAASGIRIEAPIPGKAAVGIEVPNRRVSQVLLRDVLDTEDFKNAPSKISFGLGQDIAGNTIIPDIAKMPHLLIAGATGSGKSVCVNTIITSIIYKASPEDVKLILVDPKMVELNVYNGIPHLMLPVVTDPKKAAGALNWGVREMLLRYQMFAEKNVRDMDGYNTYLEEHPEAEGEKMSRIVIIVDELADLMMAAPGEVEDAICRLAQMARAAGMHLIIATQRPSVDVITGVIKANIPSRIAFSVSSGVDSRTIIDMVGAEKLIGKGDMLFAPQGLSKPLRVQGAFVSDKEVESVVAFVKNNADGEVAYDKKIIEEITSSAKASAGTDTSSDSDEFYADALELVVEKGKASASMLQRQFRIGYNRAARLIEELEANGVIGPEDGSKPRKVLLTKEEYYRLNEEDAE